MVIAEEILRVVIISVKEGRGVGTFYRVEELVKFFKTDGREGFGYQGMHY